jgi:hypothetical protein
MTAYRLHFEEGSGSPRYLQIGQVFCQPVAEGNVRVAQDIEHGGGLVFDIGVYCINAARYLFRKRANRAGRCQSK